MIELKILGNPIPWKRPGFRKFGKTYSQQGNEKHDYELQLALQYLDEPIEGPVMVSLFFNIKRPKSHYTKVSQRLTKSAPAHHIVMPDIDNYEKFVLDCMSGIVYKDDTQVIQIFAAKNYADGDFIGTKIIIEY